MMQWTMLLLIVVVGFSGCGNGRSGGPNDPVANGTQGEEQVTVGSTTVNAVPYLRRAATGSETVTLRLDEGVNLVGLHYDNHNDNYEAECTAAFARGGDNRFFLLDKEDGSETTPLKLFSVPQSGEYSVTVDTANVSDSWELMVFHKNDLGEAGNLIEAPEEVTTSPGEDPLYEYQWHLNNEGQSEYVIFEAVAGNDINVEPVWGMGYTGEGVTVAVVDQGVEINHPDLVGNIDIEKSWNYMTQSVDTTPSNSENAHGTAVAGIIAAKGWNGIGGRGVAPEATLVSYNMLESQSVVDWSLPLESLTRGLDRVDIYNNSWGYIAGTLHPNPNELSSSLYLQFANQLAYGTIHGRGGKGAIYIKSAGNDRQAFVDDAWTNYWSANFQPEQIERYMIVVGASDADGTYSWYSSPGANLLVNAPGGDTQPAYLEVDRHHIVTTDLTGNHQGYDYLDTNFIDYHFDALGNENYDYTNRMNGTSSAGPNVSGVVALMLEANPALTWRDVRYILATTATKNGGGYVVNAAGYSFSNDYGFGRVNALQAVQAAESWTPLAEEVTAWETADPVLSANDAADLNLSKAEATLTVGDNLQVEYVNLQFTLDDNATENPGTLPDASQIALYLRSPSGTVSTLIHAPNGLEESALFYRTRVGSNAFLDENSQGEWTLNILEVDAEEEPYKDPTDLRGFKVKDIRLEIFGR